MQMPCVLTGRLNCDYVDIHLIHRGGEMTQGRNSSIIIKGIGAYAPPKVLLNSDLAKMVNTSDEWILSRTGIRERRIADNGENCSDMAASAARIAIDRAGVSSDEIDLLIVATMTPDMLFPSTACLVQTKLGLRNIPCFDVEAACSGFLYVLDIAQHMLRSGNFRHALIIGSEKISSILDWSDRSTCVLFGDGAGAAVLGHSDIPGIGVLGTLMAADGAEADILSMPGGGSTEPATVKTVDDRKHYLKMMGREVYKSAIRVMYMSAQSILKQFDLKPDEVSCVIAHQANKRIIEQLSNRLGIPMDRFPINLDRYGNTSAASIPLVLDEALCNGRIKSGDYVLSIAVGAGLTWASSLIRWH